MLYSMNFSKPDAAKTDITKADITKADITKADITKAITCAICRTGTCNAMPPRIFNGIVKAQLKEALKVFMGLDPTPEVQEEIHAVADQSFQAVMRKMMAIAEDAGCAGAETVA